MLVKLSNIFGILFGILGLLFAISTWEPEVKILAVEESDSTTGYDKLQTEDISVNISVKGFDNVRYIITKIISVKNIGTEPLLRSDVRSPIHFRFNKGVVPVNPKVSFATNPDEQKYGCYAKESKLYFEFTIMDPNQGFECRFYLVVAAGNSILPSELKSRIAGRIFEWEIKKVSDRRSRIYFVVDFIFYVICGICISLMLLFMFEKAPIGKKLEKISTINILHEKRMNRIYKKYYLLNSKFRRTALLSQIITLLPILLSLLAAIYLTTQSPYLSWALAKQLGFALDVAPLFPKVYG